MWSLNGLLRITWHLCRKANAQAPSQNIESKTLEKGPKPLSLPHNSINTKV